MHRRGFIYFSHNLLPYSADLSIAVIVAGGALLFASFALLAVHFVYRYIALCRWVHVFCR